LLAIQEYLGKRVIKAVVTSASSKVQKSRNSISKNYIMRSKPMHIPIEIMIQLFRNTSDIKRVLGCYFLKFTTSSNFFLGVATETASTLLSTFPIRSTITALYPD
jgi:hypothetical protein